MNSCEYYQELISRMVDEELSAEEQAVLAPHLEHCPDCTALFQAFQSISGLIAEDLAEPPESLSENVVAALRREEIKTKNRKTIRWKGPLATAACLAVVVAAAWLMPNMFRAGSAAPAEAPAAAAIDQAAPQAREYMLSESGSYAGYGEAAVTGAAPEAAEAEEAPAEAAGAYSIEEEAAAEPEETFLAQAYAVGSSTSPVEEHIVLDSDHAPAFSALLSGNEAQLPRQEADAVYTVSYVIEDTEHFVSLQIFGEQVYYSIDGARFYLSSFAKAEFDTLLFPKKP